MSAGAFHYSSFATQHLDEGYEFLRSAYADLHLRAETPTGRADLAADLVTFGQVSIGRLHYLIAAAIDVPDGVLEDRVSIMRQPDLHIGWETAADPAVDPGPGGTMLAPARTPYRGRWTFMSGDTALIDNLLLTDCAAADLEPGQTLAFDFSGAVSTAAADTWTRVTSLVRRVAIANADNRDGALLAHDLAELVASTALVCFPNTTMRNHASPPTRTSPESLRRAVAYIDTHLDQPITVTSIAEAARVSPRALNLTFTRHHGLSPMGYVRRARLDRAHHDLQAARPGDGSTVTTIAARWGFHSLPRFGVTYRQTYGQPPSHTLRDT